MKCLPILLMFLLISCSQEEWVQYSFKIENGAEFSKKEKGRINNNLLSKLHKFGFRESKIIDDKNILIVNSLMNPNNEKEELNFTSIFESTKLELLDTYKTSDQALDGLDSLSLEEQNFTPYYKLPIGYYAEEVLGISNNQLELEDLKAKISLKVNHFENMDLYWSEGENDETNGGLTNYKLYMIKKSRAGESPLTEMDMESINFEQDSRNSNSYLINFKFNEVAAEE